MSASLRESVWCHQGLLSSQQTQKLKLKFSVKHYSAVCQKVIKEDTQCLALASTFMYMGTYTCILMCISNTHTRESLPRKICGEILRMVILKELNFYLCAHTPTHTLMHAQTHTHMHMHIST